MEAAKKLYKKTKEEKKFVKTLELDDSVYNVTFIATMADF